MLQSRFILIFLFVPVLLFSQKSIHIIPQPVSLKLTEGQFIISKNTVLTFDQTDKKLQVVASFFAKNLKNISGLSTALNKAGKETILFQIKPSKELGNEGYQLLVTTKSIKIFANSHVGIFYGIQSLMQTLPQIRTNAILAVPCMEIIDYPRFVWRGMHLDVSRHFFSIDMVKEYIDLIAMYKMNVFHWHLCDDQGWRIEIKKYPKLTEVGAWRVDRTQKVWGEREPAKNDEQASYGGYYTQEQIKEIVAYAAERNITVVPEIEMPGHSAAALAAYPQFSCSQQPQFVVTGGQYPKGIQSNYCVGNDSSFIFLQDVLKEVFNLFPSKYIHIGGDEVDKTDWKNCAKCQQRKKTEGLKNENELQSYFIKRMENFLIANRRKLIGWDEILEGGLAPEATVMSWRGESGGIEAAKMKHDVVMTPGSPCYFDHYQAGPQGEPIAIGGFNTLKKVYDYDPIPSELTGENAKYVLGAQGNVWTEFIPTVEKLEYMVLPRMLALSEVLWTAKDNKDFTDFNERLKYHFRAFEQKGFHFCPGNFTVNIKPEFINGKLFVTLSSEILNGEIRYTNDGTEPGLLSTKYDKPIEISSSLTLKASVILNGTVMESQAAKQSFTMHKAVGKMVNYINPISKYYLADGPNSLTDGIRGTNAVNKYWHGINGKDLIAIIDMGKETSIQSISLGCLQHYKDWIFLPQYVKFEVSTDGVAYKEIETIKNEIDINSKELLHDFTTRFSSQAVKYIKVTAKNNLCPIGHPGSGQPGWLFVDELVIE